MLILKKSAGGRGAVSGFGYIGYGGENIGDDVGSPYNPSTLFQEPDFKLFQLYYGQWFLDKQASGVEAGLVAEFKTFVTVVWIIGGLFLANTIIPPKSTL
jgi:hypothetical protein